MRRAALLLVPLFLLACDRQPVAPDVSQTPAYGIADGPENPGNSPVYKFWAGGWYLSTVDYPYEPGFPEDRKAGGWVARHYDVLNAFCGAVTGYPINEIQVVEVSDLVTMFHLQSDGEIPVFIYRLEDLPPGSPTCDQLAGLWVYQGMHRLQATDNSLNGVTTHRTNSWGWSGDGTVWDRDGNEYTYKEIGHIVVGSNGNGGYHVAAHDAITIK